MNDKETAPTPELVITGDTNWWSRVMRALMYSHEKSTGDSASTSFLSCVLFDARDGGMTMCSESATSTVAITLTGDDTVEVKGSGEFLVPVPDLNRQISSMPTGDIVVSFYDDKTVKIHDEAETIEFIIGTVDIINEDMVPRAPVEHEKKVTTVSVHGGDLVEAYRSASTMALPVEKDPLAGQDPMAGCYVTIGENGIQMFSLSVSASESLIPVKGPKKSSTIATSPSTTLPRLGVFMDSEVDIAIVGDTIHIGDGTIHMVLTSLNTGNRRSKPSVENIMRVMTPAWESGVVDVSLSSHEFFTALGRADSTGSSSVEIQVTDTSVTMSVPKGNGNTPFRQKISCSTEWLDDSEHWLSMFFNISTVKSLAYTVGKRDTIRFRVSLKKDGSPWAMIIIPDDYDADDPHNYQMIQLTSRA